MPLVRVRMDIAGYSNIRALLFLIRLCKSLPISIGNSRTDKMEMKKYNQLREEIARLEKEAEKFRKEAVKAAIQQIRELMAEFGISVEDIGGGSRRGRKPGANAAKSAESKTGKSPRGKVKPKYRSPDDKKLMWTGRGRTPRWVSEWVASGRSLEELLIP